MKYVTCSLLVLAGFMFIACGVSAQVNIRAVPNEQNPKVIYITNDSLSLTIQVNDRLEVSSLLYKPANTEMLQAGKPMPLVSIDNNWTLNNVGFGLQEVTIKRSGTTARLQIHAYSNYTENPFHLLIDLGFDNSASIAADIKITNQFKDGFSDLYRSESSTSLVPGLPWLSSLQPDPGGERRLLYKKGTNYVLEKYSEGVMADYHSVDNWERQPKAPVVDMQYYEDPAFPTVLEFPGKQISVMVDRVQTDVKWNTSDIKEALWPNMTIEIKKKDTVQVFKGTIKFFTGDWHQAFNWYRNKVRNAFDFSFYKRPGLAKYKKDFLAYHSFIFNHRLYDPTTNTYLVENFLNNAKKENGGFDQFYFWHAYPRVGVDSRDQFALYEDLPGGLAGVKDFVDKAHKLNTHVYLAYNPWDVIGKRTDMYQAQAVVLGKVNADGLLLDTERKSNTKFRKAVDVYNPDALFVTEGRPDLDGLEVTTTSWDHPRTSLPMPRIDLLRFIIPEHRAFQIQRWDRDRIPLIKKAFFNATGLVVWDDVFGEVNLQSADEKILIHRYNTIMHDFSDAIISADVVPLIHTFKDELFVNGFLGSDVKVFTLYQGNHAAVSHFFDNRIIGKLFNINLPDNWHLTDVWNKRPVEIQEVQGIKSIFLPQEMPEDLGCLVATPRLIKVDKTYEGWNVTTPGLIKGTIELIGFDISMRNEITKSTEALAGLSFSKNECRQSADGYVMVQYRNQENEVKDVYLVKVGY